MPFFEFATATRIVFGAGSLAKVSEELPRLGKCVCVVTGSRLERADPVCNELDKSGSEYCCVSVIGEPTTETVLLAVEQARAAECDAVIGIGGGSVIDMGKVVAAMLTNSGELLDYLEVIGRGQSISAPPAPYVAIPTTAGTGAEVTRNAVIGSVEMRVKVSMRSPLMLPSLAVVDPELTREMPPPLTAVTGLDALTQLIEAFVSNKANPLTDGICREGLRRGARSLRRAYRDGNDKTAREDMALASLFSGLALANAKLGAVHGFAGPLGGMFAAPHGAICARLLPPVIRANVKALTRGSGDASKLARFDEVARIVTNTGDATAGDGVQWIEKLCDELDVPPLSDYGITEDHVPKAVEKAKNSSSMKGNPVALNDDQLSEILTSAL